MSDPSSTSDPHDSSPEAEKAPCAPSDDASPPDKSWVWLAIVGGHFGAAVYLLMSVLALVAVGSALSKISEDRFAGPEAFAYVAFAAVSFAFALGTEVLTVGLHRRRKWAWFAALGLFGFWLLSLLSPIGAMGLFGLLMRGSRREFGMVGASEDRRQDAERIGAPFDQESSQREGETSAAASYPSSRSNPFASSSEPVDPLGAPTDDASPPAKSWVWLAIVGGHLCAALHVLFAIGALAVAGLALADALESDRPAGLAFVFGAFVVISLTLATVVEVVTIGMHRRRPWAWFAGFAMFVLYLPFVLPVGAIGLCGLLIGGSRREFGLD
ncbi:MAG TPA: hypothetical protein VGN57_00530 [Pirellulaceae bacterium]|jgi:uncharacterized integral membrane protein|nr:hypothetical protein [Pirellulaceae bacterium]